MLRHLEIENYALIESLSLDFYPGLNIITGETGAGKSILLGALGLIQGKRADTSAIMQGRERCVVEAEFQVAQYGLQPLFEEEDIDYADEVTIRRQVSATGKSRAFINDTPVSLAQLRAVSDRVLDIHSQHANLLLQDAPFQLGVLDAFAGNAALLAGYGPVYRQWRRTLQELERIRGLRESGLQELRGLEVSLEELRRAGLKPGEQEEMEERQRELANADRLSEELAKTQAALNGDAGHNALGMLREAQQSLRRIADVMPDAGALADRVESLSLEALDVAHEAESLLDRVHADPQELARLDERLNLLYRLQTRYLCRDTEELIARMEEMEARLASFDGSEEEMARLEAEEARQRGEVEGLASQLRSTREEARAGLSEAVVNTLRQLGIAHAQFEVQLSPSEGYTATGADEVTFLFSANLQQAPQPLARVASGGEMSRVMLSLKQLVARAQSLPTIIFDEIDTGISGAVATQMGQILAGLAGTMQVINITHLPQIASHGEHHYLVYKQHEEAQTRTHIRLLAPEERVREIAKMLSGENVTAAALVNAEELLRGASSLGTKPGN